MSMLFTLSLLLVAVVGCSDSEAVPPSTNNGDQDTVVFNRNLGSQ